MKMGDVVELGRHRLMLGNALDSEHVQALMGGQKADILICDPPYGMKLDTDFRSMKPWAAVDDGRYTFVPGRQGRGRAYDAVPGDDQPFDPRPIMEQFWKVKEQFWFGGDYYAERIPDRNKGCFLVWDKRSSAWLDKEKDRAGSLDKMFGSSFELIWSRHKHKRDVIRDIVWAGFWGTQWEQERKRVGATQKPVKLMLWLLEKYSKPGANVVDLFAGTGPVLLAAERSGRTAFVMDSSEAAVELMISRWRSATHWTDTALEDAS